MVPQIKRCERCYKPISYEDTADWYSHIRIQYCDECKEIVKKEKAAERFRRFKAKEKEAAKLRDQRIRELELENSILRAKLKALWGDNNHEGE